MSQNLDLLPDSVYYNIEYFEIYCCIPRHFKQLLYIFIKNNKNERKDHFQNVNNQVKVVHFTEEY